MLYPKRFVVRKKNIILECLDYVRLSLMGAVKAFSSYGAFILFIEQKLHF